MAQSHQNTKDIEALQKALKVKFISFDKGSPADLKKEAMDATIVAFEMYNDN